MEKSHKKAVDFAPPLAFHAGMRRRVYITALSLLALLLFPKASIAVEIAPRISDREIIERLTRLEEGQKHLETSLGAKIQANAEATLQLRNDMNAQFERIDTQFARVDTQFERIGDQFNRQFQLTLGILGAFAAIVAATIGFALWDRRTMLRPVESKVKTIEAELSQNHQQLHALLEALRSLGHTDEQVANVLRQFHLL
jgi:predicted PurR-regulated permease PerM